MWRKWDFFFGLIKNNLNVTILDGVRGNVSSLL